MDGSSFPASGYKAGSPGVTPNWLPLVLTGTLGSVFVPDSSVHENNDTTKPLTGGGQNWVFDQGATLCKMGDKAPTGTTVATAWVMPPTTSAADCISLPLIRGGAIVGQGDVPGQSDVITPTCDPTRLSTGTNPGANTYFNQLGCSISHGVATTARTASSYMFAAGIKGGLFVIPLKNVASPVIGGSAGKVAGVPTLANYYSAIPEGQKLTTATVSLDGQLAHGDVGREIDHGVRVPQPAGRPGRHHPANQQDLRRSGRQNGEVHVGRQQWPAEGPDHRVRT